ncbi:MAG: hypothetical protein J3K34DRAFT_219525 [Monoraphidium minutum]|nr:MAG: hypothetical protein J3K34DRAFT_219525 [Monoraphidium minutum]
MARPRGAGRAAALLALALLSALLGGAAARTACAVDLQFVTGAKTAALSLGGRVVKPAKVAIKPETISGVAGTTTVLFDGACSVAGLTAALPTARLVANAEGFRTGLMDSRILSVADVRISSFKGVLESTGPRAANGEMPYRVRALDGLVQITVEKTGKVRTVQLAPEAMAGAGCSLLRGAANAAELRLECPKAAMARRVVADQMVADIEVRGPMTATGLVTSGRTVNIP